MLKIDDKKISIVCHSIMGVSIVALMIVAGFFDLSINHALSNPTSLFGRVFVSLGEFPAYMILPVVGTIMFYVDWQVKRQYSIMIKIAFALIVYGGFIVWGMFSEAKDLSVGIIVIYAGILTLGALFVGNMMDRELANRLVKWCLFAVCTMAVAFVLNKVFKVLWGRVRYRDMVASGSFDAFTPWYLPQGWSVDNNSFPSGHTSSACNIFIFMVLFDYSKKYQKYRVFAYIFSVAFVIMTAFSRIVIDAHYLSDVVIGGALSYLVYYTFKCIFFKNKQFTFQYKNIFGKQGSNNV